MASSEGFKGNENYFRKSVILWNPYIKQVLITSYASVLLASLTNTFISLLARFHSSGSVLSCPFAGEWRHH